MFSNRLSDIDTRREVLVSPAQLNMRSAAGLAGSDSDWRRPGSDQSDHWPASRPASSYRLQYLLVITPSTTGFAVNCLIAGLPLRRLGHGMLLGRRRCPGVPCPVTPGGRPLNTWAWGRGHMGAATNSLQT